MVPVRKTSPISIAPSRGLERANEDPGFPAHGPPALLHERLDMFAAAFLEDPRPGLIFERGRLVFVNYAARKLLRPGGRSATFLNILTVAIRRGDGEPDVRLRTRSGVYVPALTQPCGRGNQASRICFLVRDGETTCALEGFSDRQLEVVRLLVKGLTNRQIANELGLSVETIRKHVSHMLEITGTTNRAGLVGRALGR
jgi:DNA-binding CsgD family transcriptional regulator